jgi:protein-S-isoprenylcysteine O-methyltransferase Ste14
MSNPRVKVIWPIVKLWLTLTVAFFGCVFVAGQSYSELNVCWLLTIACWFVLDLCWATAAGRTTVQPNGRPNFTFLLTMWLIYALYCLPLSFVPGIGQRMLPDYEPLRVFGAMLCASGVTFAIRSRQVLANSWHHGVVPREDNALVEHGPYAIVRHPIYLGLLTGVIGMIFALGELRAIALVFGIEALLRKMPYEENSLRSAYPSQYPAYEQRVRRLLPWIW